MNFCFFYTLGNQKNINPNIGIEKELKIQSQCLLFLGFCQIWPVHCNDPFNVFYSNCYETIEKHDMNPRNLFTMSLFITFCPVPTGTNNADSDNLLEYF